MSELLIATIGTTEIIIIAVVILLLFGSTKIPQFMRGLGAGVNEFKKGVRDGAQDTKETESTKFRDHNSK